MPDPETRALMKAADKLAGYIKCVEELRAGNMEFKKAGDQTLEAVSYTHLPCSSDQGGLSYAFSLLSLHAGAFKLRSAH